MTGRAQPEERELAGPQIESDHAVVFLKGHVRESAVLAECDALWFQEYREYCPPQPGDVIGPLATEPRKPGKRWKGDVGHLERSCVHP